MYKRIYRQNGRMNHHQTSPNNKTYYETGPFHNFIHIYSLIKKLCLKLLNLNNVNFSLVQRSTASLPGLVCSLVDTTWLRYFMTSSVTSRDKLMTSQNIYVINEILKWWRHKIGFTLVTSRFMTSRFMTSRREDPNHSNETVNKRIQFVCLNRIQKKWSTNLVIMVSQKLW